MLDDGLLVGVMLDDGLLVGVILHVADVAEEGEEEVVLELVAAGTGTFVAEIVEEGWMDGDAVTVTDGELSRVLVGEMRDERDFEYMPLRVDELVGQSQHN